MVTDDRLRNYLILEKCNYETSLLYKDVPPMHCYSSEAHSLKGLLVIEIKRIHKKNRKIFIDLTRRLWKTFKVRREIYKTGRASSAIVFIAKNKTSGEEFLLGELRRKFRRNKLYMSIHLTDWFQNYLKLKQEKALVVHKEPVPGEGAIEIRE